MNKLEEHTDSEAYTYLQKTQTESELIRWARTFCLERKESIDHLLEFGSPIEKALVSKVVELAGCKS